MKLTLKGEYACLAMIELARARPDDLLKIEHIAKRTMVPRKYLEQILLALKRGGLLHSKKGAQGGYALARPAEKISVAEVVRLMDGALAPVESASRYFYAHTPSEKCKPLADLFKEIRDMVAQKMENTTLKDLVE